MKKLCLVAALALMIGCGEDESPSNNANNTSSNNGQTTETNNSTTNNGDSGVDNSGITYQDSYQLIFDTMAFDEDSLAKSLNGLLAQNFDQSLEFPIIVLVDLKSIDPDGGTLEIRGGSGLKTETDGEYIWDPEGDDSYDAGTLGSANGRVEGVLQTLNFVATLVSETGTTKMPIPIQQLEFSGNMQLSEDGSTGSIANGRMSGYLTKEDGDAAQVVIVPGGTPISITDLFKEDKLNYDSASGELVAAGEGDSWLLNASFTAKPVVIVE
jgi:hypothetical protein